MSTELTCAEATLSLSPEGFAAASGADALAAARIAGILAAKRAPDLIPLRQARALAKIEISFEPSGTTIRILAAVTGDAGCQVEALTAASVAALTLCDMAADKSAVIESVRLAGEKKAAPRLSAGTREVAVRGQRAKPQVLMGEVTAPRAAPDARREAFRNFMTAKRLRPTIWAKDAGVTTGEIMGFLTGRSRGFSGEVAEKLARAARVTVEDMFK